MKLLKRFGILLICSLFISSCFNFEEIYTINPDQSGIYTVNLDLSKVLMLMSKATDENQSKFRDTVINFKEYFAQDTLLTEAEKELFKNAKASITSDMEARKLLITINCPFTHISKLQQIKESLNTVNKKLSIMERLEGKDPKPYIATDVTPEDKFFTGTDFIAKPGFLSSFTNEAGQSLSLEQDTMGFQQIIDLMGEGSFKTIINLPTAAKDVKSRKSQISADRKTITISTTFKEMIEDPKSQNFELSY